VFPLVLPVLPVRFVFVPVPVLAFVPVPALVFVPVPVPVLVLVPVPVVVPVPVFIFVLVPVPVVVPVPVFIFVFVFVFALLVLLAVLFVPPSPPQAATPNARAATAEMVKTFNFMISTFLQKVLIIILRKISLSHIQIANSSKK
jgi:hypothetical protein